MNRKQQRTESVPAGREAKTLKGSFAWNTVGNAVYALSQWGAVVILSRLGSKELVGRYALGIAVATPILMLAQLNLRSVLATDMIGNHTFRDYRNLRLLSLLIGMAVILGVAFSSDSDATIVTLAGLALAVEWMSDIFHGLLQQHEEMKSLSISMMLRAILSITALTLGLALTGDLMIAMAAGVFSRLVVLAYDSTIAIRPVKDLVRMPASGSASLWSILRTALPLGVVVMIGSLVTNVPRYFIEHYLDTASLGVFAALASLTTAGNMLVNSMGQAVTSRLARMYAAGDLDGFRQFAIKLVAGGALLGIAGTGLALVAGQWIVNLLYGPDYAGNENLLVALAIATGTGFVAILLGYVITAARRFREQMPLQAAAMIASALVAFWLVPTWGLLGAAAALWASQVTQAIGEWIVLRSALNSAASSLTIDTTTAAVLPVEISEEARS